MNAPIKANAPGALKHAKNGANAPGRLDLFIFIRPGYVLNAPGRSFSRIFERKAPWGEPTTQESVRKGPAAEAERDASQHAVGGIAWIFFFLLIFTHQFELFYLLLCLDQWTQHD